MNTYCLFCCSGKENSVIKMLKNEGFSAIAPTVIHWTGGAAQPRKAARRLIPGYVFFDAEQEPHWDRILKDSAVLKLLSYGDGEYALRGADLDFIEWIKKNSGVIEMSSAVRVGSMIEFIDGPLKNLNGRITKVNKSRRQVQVSFGADNGIVSRVWCSMEFVCANVDTYSVAAENKREFDDAAQHEKRPQP